MEQNLPLCRKSISASTSILRNPFVRSPDQVKQAVRSTYKSPSASEKITATKTTKKLTSGGTVKTSAFTYTANKISKALPKHDEKSVRVTVAVSNGSSSKQQSHEHSRSRSGGSRIIAPIVVKSNVARASRSTETKSSPRLRYLSKHSSNVSLARTSSTYSIDSTNSKKKSSIKPLTIHRSASRSRDYTATIPATISGKSKKKKTEGKSSSVLSKRKTETNSYRKRDSRGSEVVNYSSSLKDEFQEHINDAILDHHHSIQSDHFFQNLFLRDISPDRVLAHSLQSNSPRTSVQEKALLWNTWPKKWETATRTPNVYLSQKRAVSSSKFKTLENERLRQSRSLSPQQIIRGPKSLFYDRVNKCNAYFQLSDDDAEFGTEQTSSLNYKYEERSRSEPRSRTYLHEVLTENGISTIHGAPRKDRPFSPTKEIRSPSCRRIQSFKSQGKAPARSHSLNAPNKYYSLDSRLRSRSACSVGGEKYESHLDLCSHRRSDKFKDLNRFYSNVERVGQLERATSSTDIRPIRREDELIDFDVWKQVRNHERAERELTSLVGKLKKEEKEKDFLFRPKYVEDLKWDQYADRGLRVKEKSVEDLKEIFIEKSMQHELDELKREQIEASKDTYLPLWRGNSVLDLASSMVVKYNPETPKVTRNQSLREAQERRFGLSTKLISTLSKDQVNKIRNQLSEIYCNKSGQKQEDFVINVTEEQTAKASPSLIVRSNSLVNEKDLLKPVLRRQQTRLQSNFKAESIGTVHAVHETRVSRSAERYESKTKQPLKALTEQEKKKLLQLLGKEIEDKIKERREKVLQPKETRGAIAAETAALPTPRETAEPRTCSVQFREQSKINQMTPQAKITIEAKCEAKYNNAHGEGEKKPSTLVCIETSQPTSSKCENIISSDVLKQTVIYHDDADHVKERIDYFEKKRDEEPEKIIYHAREDSSPDEDEVMRVVEQNVRARKLEQRRKEAAGLSLQDHNTSMTKFKELFNEKETTRNLIEFRTPSPEKRNGCGSRNSSPTKNFSNSTSIESVFRSRSISPIVYDAKNFRPHIKCSKTGDVQKMKNRFESLTYRPTRYNIVGFLPARRFQSDPELDKIKRQTSPSKVLVKDHESGDVSWITHKFEVKNSASRGRSRVRNVISPIPKVPFKKDNRFMPHIDIISKTASLKHEINRKSPTRHLSSVLTGEVEKIRTKFESQSPDRMSLIGQMYTSSPDMRELKDISNHLTAAWVAHKYPKPRDNARSPTSPERGPENEKVKKKPASRPNSASPPRSRDYTSILKPFYDIFADQDYDPKKHRPTHRYIPDKRNIEAEFLWRRIKRANGVSNSMKPSVKFQGCDIFYIPFCTR